MPRRTFSKAVLPKGWRERVSKHFLLTAKCLQSQPRASSWIRVDALYKKPACLQNTSYSSIQIHHVNSIALQLPTQAEKPRGGFLGTSTRSARLRKRRSDCLQPTTRLQHFKNAANHFVLSSASLVSKQAAQVKASRSWHRSLRNESELARERGEDLIMLVLPGTHTHKSLR